MKNILDYSFIYNMVQMVFGGKHSREEQAKYLSHKPQDHVMDVGCGTAELLNPYLLDCNYYGYDIGQKYIDKNKETYADYPNIHFFCEDVGDDAVFASLPLNFLNN